MESTSTDAALASRPFSSFTPPSYSFKVVVSLVAIMDQLQHMSVCQICATGVADSPTVIMIVSSG